MAPLQQLALLAAALLLLPNLSDALSSRRTPVMGWSSWSVYGCDISEQAIKEQALAIDRLGLREAGYTYIDIDDWCVASTLVAAAGAAGAAAACRRRCWRRCWR